MKEQIAQELARHFANRAWDDMAHDRRELRIMSRTGTHDINEPTREDCRDAAAAVIRLLDKDGSVG